MARGKKTGGRKAGTPNKKTAQQRARIARILSFDTFSDDKLKEYLSQMSGRDIIETFIKLQEFVTPKLARTELAGSDGERLIIHLGSGIEPTIQPDLRTDSDKPEAV